MALPGRVVVAIDPLAAAAAEEAVRGGAASLPPPVAPLRGALEWSALLAEVARAELNLVGAVPEPLSLFPLVSEPVVPHDALLEDTRRVLEWIRELLSRLLRDRSGTIRTAAHAGPVEQALIEQARADNAELIVLGARPLSATHRWLFGGTSLRLVRQANMPVLLARPTEKLRIRGLFDAEGNRAVAPTVGNDLESEPALAAGPVDRGNLQAAEAAATVGNAGASVPDAPRSESPTGTHGEIESPSGVVAESPGRAGDATTAGDQPLRFLVAVDFSEASIAGLHSAIELAQSADAEVLVLHGILPPRAESMRLVSSRLRADEVLAEAQQAALQQLRDLLDQTDHRAVVRGVRLEVCVGRPEIVLADRVRQESVDLMVLGAGSGTHLQRFVLGSTVERLLPHLGCSVWIARPPSLPADS